MIHVTDPDGDGWASCDGDCCELSSPTCLSPALVNPGAFEILNNNVDDDCDAATFDSMAQAPCSSAPDFSVVTALDVAKAMDICKMTTQNPPLSQKKWGLISALQLRADGAVPTASGLMNIQNSQTAILVDYGTGGIVPVQGPTMAGISTGMMRDQSDPGYIPPSSGTSFFYTGQPPASYLAAHGGALPPSMSCLGQCNAGAGANDAVNIQLFIRTPTNAHSFAYDFRFFTADFASWACQPANDVFLSLLQSGAPGIPADGNIAFDSSNNVFSVNNSFIKVCAPQSCYTCPYGAGQLAGTGMSNVGGGTPWLTTEAPVVPGEVIKLELMIFDVDDNVYDAAALLDNFRWSPLSSAVNTHE
ncbi:MAG: hypothetical protein L6Q76_10565 [Polyangiaceae bacterium]|nr:hypothetical protein [Polyangiaceae bacterium]